MKVICINNEGYDELIIDQNEEFQKWTDQNI